MPLSAQRSQAEGGGPGGIRKPPRCPRRADWIALNRRTGEIVPASCRANFCSWCGPINASHIAGALALAGPERAILLTGLSPNWQTNRHWMRESTYRLRKVLKGELQLAWHIEPNPKGTGHHAHAWQRGPFIPQRALSEVVASVGMGKVAFINRMRGNPNKPLGYGLKLAGMPYGMKTITETEDGLATYLEANGGRLVHTTKGFWRDAEGNACGQREAMKAWASRNRTATLVEEGKWEAMPDERRPGFTRAIAQQRAAEYMARE